MIVLLLLGAFVCVGLSNIVSEEKYGKTYGMLLLNTQPDSIEFKPKGQQKSKVLWKRDDPSFSSHGSRWEMTRSAFIIRNLTQRDSGQYVVKDKHQTPVYSSTLEVKEQYELYTLNPGEKFRFSFNLEAKSCNIYFTPTREGIRADVVLQGRRQMDWYKLDCSGFELLKPCGILMENLQMSCNGIFEVRDQNDNKALEVNLSVIEKPRDPLFMAIGVAVGVVALIGCCCLKCCSCGKSSTSEPAVVLQEGNYESEGPGQDQPNQPLMPLYPVPSYTYSEPLVLNPPTVNSAHAEVPAPADAATVLTLSDNEPQFELKGMSFPMSLPLSADVSYQDVYTSDKLNFK